MHRLTYGIGKYPRPTHTHSHTHCAHTLNAWAEKSTSCMEQGREYIHPSTIVA